jgi:gamma-glutamylcyclotransferase (GGCT)/AIG2-like uncharacterized protein YtfP
MINHPFFVYGTLRLGQGNYRLLAGHAVGEFPAVLDGHALYGPGLPYVTAGEGDSAVVGDLIFVDPGRYVEVLARLDCLEGYRPGSRHSHYEREARPVRYVCADGAEATTVAWVYLAGPAARERLRAAEPIAGGDWLAAGLSFCGR